MIEFFEQGVQRAGLVAQSLGAFLDQAGGKVLAVDDGVP
jgi:hypothetical protein